MPNIVGVHFWFAREDSLTVQVLIVILAVRKSIWKHVISARRWRSSSQMFWLALVVGRARPLNTRFIYYCNSIGYIGEILGEKIEILVTSNARQIWMYLL